MTGLVKKYDKLQNAHFGDIVDLFQTVVGAVFQNPPFPTGFIHESKLLEGLVPPPKVLEGIVRRVVRVVRVVHVVRVMRVVRVLRVLRLVRLECVEVAFSELSAIITL